MENSNNETPIKKSNKGLVVALAIVIIAILVALGLRYMKPVSPKDVFVSKISTTLNEVKGKNSANAGKINSTITLSGNIETDNAEIKQMADYINQGKITANIQGDLNSKKALLGLNVDYQNENLINGKVYYANGDDNIYVYVQDLFDKYFKVNLKDTLGSEKSDILNNNSVNFGKVLDNKKAIEIVEKAILDNLKEEYFSKEEADGMNKNLMKLTVGDLRNILVNVITSLKDNEEYLKCFEKSDEVKKSLENALNAINQIEKDADNYSIEIALYTKGSSKDVKKMEIKVKASENEEATFTVNKVDDNNYEFNANVKTEQSNMKVNAEALNGTIKREKVDNNTEKVTLVVNNIPEVGKVTLNIEMKKEQNTDIDNVDVSNSVEINNLSQADMMKLYSNLMNMKIYSLLAPMMQ